MATHALSQDHTNAATWALDVVGLLIAISPAVIYLAYLITA